MCDSISEVMWAKARQVAKDIPCLTEDIAYEARLFMKTLKLSGGCWDKQTHKRYGMCHSLTEHRTV